MGVLIKLSCNLKKSAICNYLVAAPPITPITNTIDVMKYSFILRFDFEVRVLCAGFIRGKKKHLCFVEKLLIASIDIIFNFKISTMAMVVSQSCHESQKSL